MMIDANLIKPVTWQFKIQESDEMSDIDIMLFINVKFFESNRNIELLLSKWRRDKNFLNE